LEGLEGDDRRWLTHLEAQGCSEPGRNDALIGTHLRRVLRLSVHPLGSRLETFASTVLSCLPDELSEGGAALAENDARGVMATLAVSTKAFTSELARFLLAAFPALERSASLGGEEAMAIATLATETALFAKVEPGLTRLARCAGATEDAAYATAVCGVAVASLEELGVHRRYHGCELGGAVGVLQGLEEEKSPGDKARCILRAQEEILRACQATGAPLGADDLLPLLTYVTTRAQVPHLASQVKYAVDFLAEGLCNGELGYYLTCMHAVVAALIREQGAGG